MNDIPGISICVTTFKRPESVRSVVDNILDQMTEEDQLILVNDDPSVRICAKEFKDFLANKELLIVNSGRNLGLSGARNLAISHSTRPYFTFCDDDDIWPRGYLKEVKMLITSFPHLAGIFLYPSLRTEIESISMHALIAAGITPPVAMQVYKRQVLNLRDSAYRSIKTGVDHDLWLSLSNYSTQRYGIFSCSGRLTPTDEEYPRNTKQHHDRLTQITKNIETVWSDDLESLFSTKSIFLRQYTNYLKYKENRDKISNNRIFGVNWVFTIIYLLKIRLSKYYPAKVFF